MVSEGRLGVLAAGEPALVSYWLQEDLGDGRFTDLSRSVAASVLGDVARRRTQSTGDRLARVLALKEEGGIEAVMDGLEASRPHAYRLLKRARQEMGDVDGKRNALTKR